MPWTDAFAKHEAIYKAQVMASTWGHLAPEPRREYPCFVVFTQTAWGDYQPIDADFTGLDDSPWLYEDLIEFVATKAAEKGCIYRFDGKYVKFKNGGHHFTGKIRKLYTPSVKEG